MIGQFGSGAIIAKFARIYVIGVADASIVNIAKVKLATAVSS
jgi:hypothetical protein